MRKLLLSLFAMTALLFVLDRAIGAGLERLFRASANPTDGDVLGHAWTMRAPVIVCGASRASHHYVSDSLGADLGAPVFNLGRDGSWGAAYEYGTAGILLNHYTPSLWIMDVDPMLVRTPEILDRLSCFLPWAHSEPVARELVGLRSHWEPVRLLSRIYPYNSMVLRLVAAHRGQDAAPRAGFLPLLGAMSPADVEREAVGVPGARADLDTLKLRFLARAIGALHARGVTVVAVRSPRFVRAEAAVAREHLDGQELEQVFARHGVRFLDFSSSAQPQWADPSLYRDAAHLNETGALRFTAELADSLRAHALLPAVRP